MNFIFKFRYAGKYIRDLPDQIDAGEVSQAAKLFCYHKRLTEAANNRKKDAEFQRLIDKKRDFLNYPTLVISFGKNNTHVILKLMDRTMYHVSVGSYIEFLKDLGTISKQKAKNFTLVKAMTPNMMDFFIKYLLKENVKYVMLQTIGFGPTKHECLQMIFNRLNVIAYVDTTKITFGEVNRRPKRPRKKQRYKPMWYIE